MKYYASIIRIINNRLNKHQMIGAQRNLEDHMVNSFKSISLEDKEAIEFYLLKYSSFCLYAFTFSSLVSWAKVYHDQWTILDDTSLIQIIAPDDDKEQLMQPIGEFPEALQRRIIQYAHTLDYRLAIYGVSNAFISLHPEFVAHFERIERRDMDSYIYSAEDLATLKGGNYQPKRNLINQFEANNRYGTSLIVSKLLKQSTRKMKLTQRNILRMN